MSKPVKVLLKALPIVLGCVAVIYCSNLLFNQALRIESLEKAVSAKAVAEAEAADSSPIKRRSVFSWEDEPYRLTTRANFYTLLEDMEITDIYQSVSDENLYSSELASFLSQAKKMDMSVYYLTGERTWGVRGGAQRLNQQIKKVAAFNKAMGQQSQFKGIIFDAEFYLSEEWNSYGSEDRKKLVQSYVDVMKIAYSTAKKAGIKMILCLPNWMDSSYGEALEQLIAEACDEVAIMNYDRSDEYDSIEAEVSLAKKYKKDIFCIFEFQEVGKHQLTDNETYNNLGIPAADKSFNALNERFGYSGFYQSYHYYKPLAELMGLE